MTKQSETNPGAYDLRQRAEQQLAAKPDIDNMIDQHRLLHELQVNQIELEMQNEALREARTEAELAVERYVELYDYAPIAYFTLSSDGIIQQTNFRGGRLLGIEPYKISGQYFANSVSSNCWSVFKAFMEKVFSSDGTQSCEISLHTGNCLRWVAIEASVDSTRKTCLAAVLDISESKRVEQELQLAATIYLALDEAIMVANEDNRIITVNAAFTRLTGYTEAEVIGKPNSLLKSGRQDAGFYREMWNQLNTKGHWQGEIWDKRKNGTDYLAWLSISVVYNGRGEVIRRVAMFTDITEKKHAEETIRIQANFDPLTGLPNRRLFHDRLQQTIKKSRRANQTLALMFLDIDHFKDVNDTLGHDMGDNLLKEAAQRLRGCVRESDTLARLGGDEFTVILGEQHEFNSIDRVAQKILSCMMAPFQLGSERCYVTASIGITLYPDDAVKVDELLKKADQAMYAAKQQGRNRYCYFTSAMQDKAETRLGLAKDLRTALADNEFWVAYQAIVELNSGDIQKAEALIRWQHPTRGLVSPADFIPIAEDTGMILEIGEWVFRQAANQVALWRASIRPQFQISVNKSPVQFHNTGDSQTSWYDYLLSKDLQGDCIAVEITEGLLLDASSIVSEKLLAFRDAGIQVSIDDFGTGYSSLSYLKKFDIDYLKIDQIFVANLSANSTEMALCEAMILMAHKLGLKVIAEGIETQEQRDLLLQAGCDYGQGYLFSRPMPAGDFEGLFRTAPTTSHSRLH